MEKRDTYKTRCRTCGADAPRLGDGGAFGTPSASTRAGLEFDAPRFGVLYAALAGVRLITPAMDRFLAFLKAHRGHTLEQECSAPDLSCSEAPWPARLEPRLTDDVLASYETTYYGAECVLCDKRYASRQRTRLRRFRPGPVAREHVRKFVDDAWFSVYCENTAAPLSSSELYRLGTFLAHRHPGHPIRVCLLSDDEARRAFLARRRRARKRRPQPPATEEAWWSTLERSGWLDEVPKREAARIRGAMPSHGLRRAFLALAPSGFDAETIENTGDYRRILRAYEIAACGAFRPTKVRDRIDLRRETASVSFQVGSKRFSRTFPQADDYVAEGFTGFLHDVLDSLGIARRFHALPTGDQTVALVCVTPETYSRAQELGLIPYGPG